MIFSGIIVAAGFAMTVYGVSHGIGGFADFLKGSVTSEQIKSQVGEISKGLETAFDWTLFSLPVSFVTFITGLIVLIVGLRKRPQKNQATF